MSKVIQVIAETFLTQKEFDKIRADYKKNVLDKKLEIK